MKEKDFQKLIINTVSNRYESVDLIRRNVGVFRSYDKKRIIRIEKKGSPDIYGYVQTKHGLIHLEIEVKLKSGRMSPDQISFRKEYEEKGGIYFLAKDMLEFMEEFDKKMEELDVR